MQKHFFVWKESTSVSELNFAKNEPETISGLASDLWSFPDPTSDYDHCLSSRIGGSD